MSVSRELVIVSYGGGTDSTALLIEMVNRGEPAPHAILFADTGGEHPHTYAFLAIFSDWLEAHGYPRITIIKKGGRDITLEQDCLEKNTLPAVAFGWKTCSQRFKVQPQEKWMNNDVACQAQWIVGRRVTNIIGMEYGEERRVRPNDEKYIKRYPLIEWKIDREACIEIIKAAGLPLPGKSSCFFCPNMKKPEIEALGKLYPDLLQRALDMEARALPHLETVKGLGRRFAWRDVVEGRPTPPVAEPEDPCGCYSGGDDLTSLITEDDA
jgi:hypothetical protein